MKKLFICFILLFTKQVFAETSTPFYYTAFFNLAPVVTLGLGIANFSQIERDSIFRSSVPVWGIAFGSVTTAIGVVVLEYSDSPGAGIVLGSIGLLTVGVSIANQLRMNHFFHGKTSWNLISVPTKGKEMGLAISITHVF